jgi:hypothetical protein
MLNRHGVHFKDLSTTTNLEIKLAQNSMNASHHVMQ